METPIKSHRPHKQHWYLTSHTYTFQPIVKLYKISRWFKFFFLITHHETLCTLRLGYLQPIYHKTQHTIEALCPLGLVKLSTTNKSQTKKQMQWNTSLVVPHKIIYICNYFGICTNHYHKEVNFLQINWNLQWGLHFLKPFYFFNIKKILLNIYKPICEPKSRIIYPILHN